MNKLVVTGGAGFIGSHLANKLIELQAEVFVIDNLSSGKAKYLKKDKKLRLLELDIKSPKAIKAIKEIKPNSIIHLAAQSSLSTSYKKPDLELEENFLTIVDLCQVAKAIKIQKFIFASSAAVYSSKNTLPTAEDALLEPVSPYGLSKLCTEYYLSYIKTTQSFPCTTLRFANIYGPKQNFTAEGGVAAIFITQMLKNQNPRIFGKGDQTRDFIYVDDVVDAIIKSLNPKINGTYNVSTSKQISINELANLIKKNINPDITIKIEPEEPFGVLKSCLSNKKIKNDLNWTPTTTLEEGITKTIDYFKSNS